MVSWRAIWLSAHCSTCKPIYIGHISNVLRKYCEYIQSSQELRARGEELRDMGSECSTVGGIRFKMPTSCGIWSQDAHCRCPSGCFGVSWSETGMLNESNETGVGYCLWICTSLYSSSPNAVSNSTLKIARHCRSLYKNYPQDKRDPLLNRLLALQNAVDIMHGATSRV